MNGVGQLMGERCGLRVWWGIMGDDGGWVVKMRGYGNPVSAISAGGDVRWKKIELTKLENL